MELDQAVLEYEHLFFLMSRHDFAQKGTRDLPDS